MNPMLFIFSQGVACSLLAFVPHVLEDYELVREQDKRSRSRASRETLISYVQLYTCFVHHTYLFVEYAVLFLLPF